MKRYSKKSTIESFERSWSDGVRRLFAKKLSGWSRGSAESFGSKRERTLPIPLTFHAAAPPSESSHPPSLTRISGSSGSSATSDLMVFAIAAFPPIYVPLTATPPNELTIIERLSLEGAV